MSFFTQFHKYAKTFCDPHRQRLGSVILLLILMVPINVVRADSVETSNRIKGVAQFLLDRAQDNYFYIFENKIKDNKIFECYFPNTYQYVKSGDLKILLTAGNAIWRKSVEQDIKANMRLQLYAAIYDALEKANTTIRENAIEALQHATIDINGQTYQADQMPLDKKQEIQPDFDRLYQPFIAISGEFKQIKQRYFPNMKNGCAVIDSSSQSKQDDAVKNLRADLDNLSTALRGNIKKFLGNPKFHFDAVARKKFSHLDELVNYYETNRRFLEKVDVSDSEAAGNYLLRVLNLDRAIKKQIQDGINPLKVDVDSYKYHEFRRYTLLFAQLADAESPDTVKVALQEVTLPPVSFGLKRMPGRSTWMITAYLGMSAGREKLPSDKHQSYTGMIAPLGLEYSRGFSDKSALSILFAPFDFGQPINMELQGNAEGAKLSDIVTPGVYLAYGIRNYPLVIGIGYNRGRALLSNANSESRYMLFVAFDMPLFRFE